ncbi:hypothetical protein RE428_11980 [Marinobacter nanhaiticus D15-8W]|uniref:Uncharacterized protein n=1 Tax=Marinobacter nanhaiticus D15-8W TaxID=626887 RepID=N6WMX1_9GAMM|nr:hypothetical protein [Marinobacter nanhaiticus]ENO12831.1 hypothetical protein J057_15575 [Marinobacter nanhaiticus D15-8W]BES70180.1 hypothetical protein RE428_11980 [Marinobacter nanhaiticus D15-8W]
MNRRAFLTGLGGLLALVGFSGYLLPVQGSEKTGITVTKKLRRELAELSDPRFQDYASTLDLETLTDALASKGVVSPEYGVDYERLRALATQEPLIVYHGFYYTPSELELYSLAYLVSGV